jgi:hypothetical protein
MSLGKMFLYGLLALSGLLCAVLAYASVNAVMYAQDGGNYLVASIGALSVFVAVSITLEKGGE